MKRIPLQQKEYREIQLSILKEVARTADDNAIPYSLAYGTMIGAVRHKGYIPWDDDIDILLLREDYEKLLPLLRASSCPWLKVVDNTDSNHYFPFAKATDNRTLVKEDDTLIQNGVWIDIFPVDRIPEDPREQKRYLKRCEVLRAMVISMNTDFSSQRLGKKRVVKRGLWLLSHLLGKRRVARWYDGLVRRYEGSASQTVACLSSAYIPREAMPLSVYQGTMTVPFEEGEFAILNEFDHYLSHLYGRYMVLPPEGSRKTHEATAWRLEEEA